MNNNDNNKVGYFFIQDFLGICVGEETPRTLHTLNVNKPDPDGMQLFQPCTSLKASITPADITCVNTTLSYQ